MRFPRLVTCPQSYLPQTKIAVSGYQLLVIYRRSQLLDRIGIQPKEPTEIFAGGGENSLKAKVKSLKLHRTIKDVISQQKCSARFDPLYPT